MPSNDDNKPAARDGSADKPKRINTGKPWTREEMDYILSASRQGQTIVEIAEYLQRDGDEVDAKADFMGI